MRDCDPSISSNLPPRFRANQQEGKARTFVEKGLNGDGRIRDMAVMTGLSGNEMYCLHQKGLQAGDLVIGNSVFSVGVIGSLGSGLKTLAGGEVTQITSVIHEGRLKSYERMVVEAQRHGGIGITGVNSELVQHGTNVE